MVLTPACCWKKRAKWLYALNHTLCDNVNAFIRRKGTVTREGLDAHCKNSGLPNFKRPRDYVFVADVPRSPVGKLLRRKLVANEYELEPNPEHKPEQQQK